MGTNYKQVKTSRGQEFNVSNERKYWYLNEFRAMNLAIPTRSQTSICFTFLKVEKIRSARQMSDDSHVRNGQNEKKRKQVLDDPRFFKVLAGTKDCSAFRV